MVGVGHTVYVSWTDLNNTLDFARRVMTPLLLLTPPIFGISTLKTKWYGEEHLWHLISLELLPLKIPQECV